MRRHRPYLRQFHAKFATLAMKSVGIWIRMPAPSPVSGSQPAAPMGEVNQHLKTLAMNLVVVRHECWQPTHATRIVFIPWMIEPLRCGVRRR